MEEKEEEKEEEEKENEDEDEEKEEDEEEKHAQQRRWTKKRRMRKGQSKAGYSKGKVQAMAAQKFRRAQEAALALCNLDNPVVWCPVKKTTNEALNKMFRRLSTENKRWKQQTNPEFRFENGGRLEKPDFEMTPGALLKISKN